MGLQSATDLTVDANISAPGPLEACQALSLSVKGGTGPYTVTITAYNFPTVLNQSLADSSDVLTWFNNVPANSQLLGNFSIHHHFLKFDH